MRIETFPTLGSSGLLGGTAPSGARALRWPGASFHYQARGAIYRLARALEFAPGEEALVGAYHCGVEVQALEHAGATVRFYRVDARLQADVEDLASRLGSRTRLVLATRYFGFPQRIAEIAALCGTHGVHLLEDRAHVLYSVSDGPADPPQGSAVYSLTKLLPVPDGAVLLGAPPGAGDELRGAPALPVLRRVGLLGLGRLRTRHGGAAGVLEGSLRAVLRGARGLGRRGDSTNSRDSLARLDPSADRFEPQVVDFAMSSWARRVLARTDLDAVARRRRENAAVLDARMRGVAGFVPVFDRLPQETVPMFYPVRVADRDRLQARLAAHGIGSFVFGGHLHPRLPRGEFPEAGDLSRQVLGIPIHQDLDERALDALVGTLKVCLQV